MALFPSDRVAYVTGAGSGIGRAITIQFAADGVRQLVLVDVQQDGLDETLSFLKDSSPEAKAIAVVADVSKEDDIRRSIDDAVKAFGRIDHCVNGAGISGNLGKTSDLPTEECDRVLGVNLKGTWYGHKYQIKQFLQQEMQPLSTGLHIQSRGTIVNIASISGLGGAPYCGPYSMSKHGILGLTKTDAMQYGNDGIRVNAVCPAATRTPILPEVAMPQILAMTQAAPIKRLGLPEEIAFVVCFLSSDRASFMTGASIPVDGGWTCQ